MPAGTVSPIDPCLDQLARWTTTVADDAHLPALLTALEALPDPRDRRGRRYRLPSLIAVALCAVATGARSFYAIADWVTGVPQEVLARCGIRFRIPSEATIRQVLGRIDGDTLDRVLSAHLAACTDATGCVAVAVDGKTIRGARIGTTVAPHLVSAVTHAEGVVLGQCRTADKSNETPAVRRLVRGLDLAGAVVTVDAMHTQKTTARCLREQCRAEYVMVVKANQPGLLARVQSQPWEQVPVVWSDPLERGHGREEQRSYKIVTVARGLRFPYAQQAIEVTRLRRVIGTEEWSIEVVYAICSLPCEQAPPRLLASWIRGHWAIENKVHYVRDVTFDEDRSTVRAGHGPQVMATLRNVVIGLHRRAGQSNIAQACRRLAANPHHAVDLVLRA